MEINRHGLAYRGRRHVFAVVFGRKRLGFLVGIWRTHDLKSDKLDKINEYMREVWGPKKRLVVACTDLRCLTANVPGPSGVFWWSLRK